MQTLKLILLAGLWVIANNCLAVPAQETTAQKETIRVGTWNIEHFMMMFDQDRMPERSREQAELWDDEEDQYEVARTIRDFAPDILVIQECCDEPMLKLFVEKWLPGLYPYAKVFTSNTEGQYLGVLAKAGFEALQAKEYYNDPDPISDKRVASDKSDYNKEGENKIFCRGPGFILFKTPAGSKMWIGTTHSKSKSGNSKAVTEWRIREYERTRQICGELVKTAATPYLAILGDFNDDFGKDSIEQSLGSDAIETMLKGTGPEKLISLDEIVRKADPTIATYHCEIKPKKYRSFIDHVFSTPEMAATLDKIVVIDDSIAYVASDHLPILCIFSLPIR